MISLNKFSIEKLSSKGNTAAFRVGPLPKGYGNTLGNSLRRVLLSSLPGAAVTSVKIDGVQHEYSTMEGVADDLLAIVLSLKNVVINLKTLEPQTLELTVQGKEGQVVEVKAGDFEKNSNVEIVNPEYVITRLSGSKAKFKAEVTIERGAGYRHADNSLRKEIGVLPVDSNFSPVKLVTFSVLPARVGQETELDQLEIEVTTNGSVTPVEALNIAGDLLNDLTVQFKSESESLLKGGEIAISLNEQQKLEDSKKNLVSSTVRPNLKVADLNLSTRLTNALLKAGYTDLNMFDGMTEEEAANIRGMGSKSLTELFDVLKKHGVILI